MWLLALRLCTFPSLAAPCSGGSGCAQGCGCWGLQRLGERGLRATRPSSDACCLTCAFFFPRQGRRRFGGLVGVEKDSPEAKSRSLWQCSLPLCGALFHLWLNPPTPALWDATWRSLESRSLGVCRYMAFCRLCHGSNGVGLAPLGGFPDWLSQRHGDPAQGWLTVRPKSLSCRPWGSRCRAMYTLAPRPGPAVDGAGNKSRTLALSGAVVPGHFFYSPRISLLARDPPLHDAKKDGREKASQPGARVASSFQLDLVRRCTMTRETHSLVGAWLHHVAIRTASTSAAVEAFSNWTKNHTQARGHVAMHFLSRVARRRAAR